MGLVTEVDDAAAPTVLIVDNNPMSSMRLSNLFKTRNFMVELCEDGDQAVDEYIRLDPELVVLSLDIPSLDGHLAALEMREHGGESRIVFVAPARMADVARNAAYSAGAVAWLQKPISGESLEAAWPTILGTIPEAPGLDDLDELYPDRGSIEEDTGPLAALLPYRLYRMFRPSTTSTGRPSGVGGDPPVSEVQKGQNRLRRVCDHLPDRRRPRLCLSGRHAAGLNHLGKW